MRSDRARSVRCLCSVRIPRVRRRGRLRPGGLRGVDHCPVDMRLDGDPARGDPLENGAQSARLLHQRLSGPGGPQPRVHGHRARHGLDIVHAAVPTGRGPAEAAAPDPGLLRVDQVVGHRNVGHQSDQTGRKQRLPVNEMDYECVCVCVCMCVITRIRSELELKFPKLEFTKPFFQNQLKV